MSSLNRDCIARRTYGANLLAWTGDGAAQGVHCVTLASAIATTLITEAVTALLASANRDRPYQAGETVELLLPVYHRRVIMRPAMT